MLCITQLCLCHEYILSQYTVLQWIKGGPETWHGCRLTLIRLGGGGGGRICLLDVWCKAINAAFHDSFLSNLTHLLTPNSWCPGAGFQSYATFCKSCTFCATCWNKTAQNVISCTFLIQIVFSEKIHKCMNILTSVD